MVLVLFNKEAFVRVSLSFFNPSRKLPYNIYLVKAFCAIA